MQPWLWGVFVTVRPYISIALNGFQVLFFSSISYDAFSPIPIEVLSSNYLLFFFSIKKKMEVQKTWSGGDGGAESHPRPSFLWLGPLLPSSCCPANSWNETSLKGYLDTKSSTSRRQGLITDGRTRVNKPCVTEGASAVRGKWSVVQILQAVLEYLYWMDGLLRSI